MSNYNYQSGKKRKFTPTNNKYDSDEDENENKTKKTAKLTIKSTSPSPTPINKPLTISLTNSSPKLVKRYILSFKSPNFLSFPSHNNPHLTHFHLNTHKKQTTTPQRQNHKLNLVLDIDLTLLHSIRVTTRPFYYTSIPQMFSFTLPGDTNYYLVKLRPHLIEFLDKIKEFFNIYAYTNGLYNYAHTVLSTFDPNHDYFPLDRIFARHPHGFTSIINKNI